VSYRKVETLLRRSRAFLEAVFFHAKKGNYDVALHSLEVAMQLYFKAIILEHTGSYPEIHEIRQLLSKIVRITGSRRIANYVRKHRSQLLIIEHAYSAGKYGELNVSREDFEELVKVGLECLKLVASETSAKDITENLKE